jgi:hypothetical protein
MAWQGMPVDLTIGFHGTVEILAICMVFGIDFSFKLECLSELKTKAKTIYADFVKETKLVWAKTSVNLPNACGVLHPVDLFLKQIYDRKFPRACAEAFSTYKRTNPTLQLRLEHLEKYAEPNAFDVSSVELNDACRSILDETCQAWF